MIGHETWKTLEGLCGSKEEAQDFVSLTFGVVQTQAGGSVVRAFSLFQTMAIVLIGLATSRNSDDFLDPANAGKIDYNQLVTDLPAAETAVNDWVNRGRRGSLMAGHAGLFVPAADVTRLKVCMTTAFHYLKEIQRLRGYCRKSEPSADTVFQLTRLEAKLDDSLLELFAAAAEIFLPSEGKIEKSPLSIVKH